MLTLSQALNSLCVEFCYAKHNPEANGNPVAYALHQVWLKAIAPEQYSDGFSVTTNGNPYDCSRAVWIFANADENFTNADKEAEQS